MNLKGLAINGAYLAPYVLMLELSGEKYACMLSQVVNIPFVFGELVFIGFAYAFRDYRDMIRWSFAPCFPPGQNFHFPSFCTTYVNSTKRFKSFIANVFIMEHVIISEKVVSSTFFYFIV